MSRARLCQPRETLVPALLDLIARRPELRDVGIAGYFVGIAGYLVGAAVDGAPGWPLSITTIVYSDGTSDLVIDHPSWRFSWGWAA